LNRDILQYGFQNENCQLKIETLKELSEKASEVILATDPDREGEAIAWHLKQVLAFSESFPNFRPVVMPP